MQSAVVDLFCGVGGLTCGLKKSGLNVVAGLDNDSTCEFAYTENNNTKFILCRCFRVSFGKKLIPF